MYFLCSIFRIKENSNVVVIVHFQAFFSIKLHPLISFLFAFFADVCNSLHFWFLFSLFYFLAVLLSFGCLSKSKFLGICIISVLLVFGRSTYGPSQTGTNKVREKNHQHHVITNAKRLEMLWWWTRLWKKKKTENQIPFPEKERQARPVILFRCFFFGIERILLLGNSTIGMNLTSDSAIHCYVLKKMKNSGKTKNLCYPNQKKQLFIFHS